MYKAGDLGVKTGIFRLFFREKLKKIRVRNGSAAATRTIFHRKKRRLRHILRALDKNIYYIYNFFKSKLTYFPFRLFLLDGQFA